MCTLDDEIKRSGIVTNLAGYYNLAGEDWDAYVDSRTDEQIAKDDLIEERLAVELALFVLRRLVNVPGETVDAFYRVNGNIYDEYVRRYGEYRDVNANVDF